MSSLSQDVHEGTRGGTGPDRSYPEFVTLFRRSHRSAGEFSPSDPAALEEWLLTDAVDVPDMLRLFESFVWRLGAAGLPVDRATLHVGTLHPQVYGYAWSWERADGICDEIQVAESSLSSDAYRRNPLARVIEAGETVVVRLDHAGAPDPSPLLVELAGRGFTQYLAIPLRSARKPNAVTLATRQAGGFTSAQSALLERLYRLFALHVDRHVARLIAGNVLATYLGSAAGSQVLEGTIKRGSGAPIDAIIWMSDLRGFTERADRLPGPAMLAVLNAYFDRLVAAVSTQGGDVLKFIGDGLLAVFPFAGHGSDHAAARAALAAARAAHASLRRLNEEEPDPLPEIRNWRPLETGIALHAGRVFFGNMGAPDRLDFTVVGPVVNTAARVEGLSKRLGRPLLLTEAVARLLDEELTDLGAHQLSGVSQPVRLFAPTGDPPPEAGRGA